jgi:peptidoglycan/LPS O-acetylase OafA/YrhL
MHKLDVINGLRGWAILAVIYHHLFGRLTEPGFASQEIFGVAFNPLSFLSNGWLGVNLFFMLSGFVLAYPFIAGRRHMKDWENIRDFYRRRGRRLLPLYYLCVVICMIFLWPMPALDVFLRDVWLMGTVTFNFTSDMWAPKYNWVLWSLGIEIWFSVVFPFIVLAVTRWGIGPVFLIVLIVSLGTRVAGSEMSFAGNNLVLNPIKDSLPARLDEFLWGYLLCHLYVNHSQDLIRRFALPLFVLGFLLILLGSNLWDAVQTGLLTVSAMAYLNLVIDAGLAAVLMSLLCMEKNLLRRCFSNHLIQLLGIMCYSLYVWHGVLMLKLVNLDLDPYLVIYSFSLVVVSLLTYRYVEFGHVSDTRSLFDKAS